MSSLATPIAGFLTTVALLLTTTTVTANNDDTHPFLVSEMDVASVLPDDIGFRTLTEQKRAGKVDVRLIDKADARIFDTPNTENAVATHTPMRPTGARWQKWRNKLISNGAKT